jgi:hypothetical protein
MKALVFLLGRRKIGRTILLALAVTGLALVATTPAIAAESHVEASCETGAVGSDTTDDAGAAELSAPGFPWGVRASASELTLSGSTSVTGDTVRRWCDALSRFTTTVTVEPGTSGLSAGDPVTLRLSVGLDGGLSADVGPTGADFAANALVNASLRMTVPDRIVCAPDDGIEACKPAELARFSAEGRHEVEGALPNAGFPGFALRRYTWGWSLAGDRGETQGDQDARVLQDCDWPGPFPCDIVVVDPSVLQSSPDYRGTRAILVDAVVGDRIELTGALSFLAQALNGSAKAQFAGVFPAPGGSGPEIPLRMRASLTPGPGFEGLTLRHELTPPADDPPADTDPPTLTVPEDLTTNATSAAGAVVTYEVTATDNVPGGLGVQCSPPSGSTFPNGTTTVTCTATDVAGNTATREFAVEVVGAAGQLLQLVDKTRQFLALPALPPALKQTLVSAFESVTAGRKTVACTGLRVYELVVRLMRSRELTSAERAELLADVSRIRSVIGCT